MLRSNSSPLRRFAALVGMLGIALPAIGASAQGLVTPVTMDSSVAPSLLPVTSLSSTVSSRNLAATGESYGVAELLTEFSKLHPDVVATISVDIGLLGPVARKLMAERITEADASLRLEVAVARQSILNGEILRTGEELRVAQEADLAAQVVELQAQADLREMAVSTFIVVEEAALESFGVGLEGNSLETIASDSQRRLTLGLEEAEEISAAARLSVLNVTAHLVQLDLELQAQTVAASEAAADQQAAQEQIRDLEPRFEAVLMTTKLSGTDIPVVVFDAYYRTQLRVAEEQPGCQVRWDQLAGIGKVETSHGSFGGNVVGPTGRTDGEILGPVLDGEPFAAIGDTDGGRLDGNPVWDRAVGPMQFIPGSWSIYGRDGNDDGTKDPHNVYDAALAAGGHLCGTTGGLSQRSNFQHALLGYNQSAPYGVLVMSFADSYLGTVGEIVIAPSDLPESLVVPEFG